MKKKVKKIVFQILIIYVCLVGALYMAQRSMIYFPSKDKPDITPYEAQGVFEITDGDCRWFNLKRMDEKSGGG